MDVDALRSVALNLSRSLRNLYLNTRLVSGVPLDILKAACQKNARDHGIVSGVVRELELALEPFELALPVIRSLRIATNKYLWSVAIGCNEIVVVPECSCSDRKFWESVAIALNDLPDSDEARDWLRQQWRKLICEEVKLQLVNHDPDDLEISIRAEIDGIIAMKSETKDNSEWVERSLEECHIFLKEKDRKQINRWANDSRETWIKLGPKRGRYLIDLAHARFK